MGRMACRRGLIYRTRAEAIGATADLSHRRVVIVDTDERRTEEPTEGVITLEVGGGDGTPLSLRHPGGTESLDRPDRLELLDALTCARRLAAHRAGRGTRSCPGLADLIDFDPIALWPGCRYGASKPCRAAPTASIIRSEPMTIMCSALFSGTA